GGARKPAAGQEGIHHGNRTRQRTVMNYKAEIPYGAYWSTPFARWQGSFSNLHSIEFAAHVARLELARRKIDPQTFDHGVLGFSVPQKHSFFGLPWLTGL